jgi:hypothetical protein
MTDLNRGKNKNELLKPKQIKTQPMNEVTNRN